MFIPYLTHADQHICLTTLAAGLSSTRSIAWSTVNVFVLSHADQRARRGHACSRA